MVVTRWVLMVGFGMLVLGLAPTAAAAPSFASSHTDPIGDAYNMQTQQKSTITGADLVMTESRLEGGKIVITATTHGELPADRTQSGNIWYFTGRAYTNPGYKISADLSIGSKSGATLYVTQGDDQEIFPVEFTEQAKGATIRFDASLIPSGVTCWSVLGSLSFQRGTNELHMDVGADVGNPGWKSPCDPGGGGQSGGGSGAGSDAGDGDAAGSGDKKASGRLPGFAVSGFVLAVVVAGVLRRAPRKEQP